MADYSKMALYYDLIMTSGYYNYPEIVKELTARGDFRNVLEIGCGTGLIIEELLKRRDDIEVTGVDLTEAMLSIARQRLMHFSNVRIEHQNVVDLDLNAEYDMAFSYGGVWYFVNDGSNKPCMVSHIQDSRANLTGMARVAEHLKSRGRLLLGVQGPHRDYSAPVSNGYVYSQKIQPAKSGFAKNYFLHDGTEIVMEQRIAYRTYSLAEALDLLGSFGLNHETDFVATPLFMSFVKA